MVQPVVLQIGTCVASARAHGHPEIAQLVQAAMDARAEAAMLSLMQEEGAPTSAPTAGSAPAAQPTPAKPGDAAPLAQSMPLECVREEPKDGSVPSEAGNGRKARRRRR